MPTVIHLAITSLAFFLKLKPTWWFVPFWQPTGKSREHPVTVLALTAFAETLHDCTVLVALSITSFLSQSVVSKHSQVMLAGNSDFQGNQNVVLLMNLVLCKKRLIPFFSFSLSPAGNSSFQSNDSYKSLHLFV